MKNEFHNMTGILQVLVDRITSCGKILGELNAATTIDLEKIDDPGFSISIDSYFALWEYAIEVIGDPALALRPITYKDPRQLDVLERIAQYSADLNEALHHWTQYNWFLAKARKIQLRKEKGLVTIAFEPGDMSYQSRHVAEFNLALFIHQARSLTGIDIRTKKVHFFHPQPEYVDVYRETFKSEVLFKQAENALFIPEKVLSLPIISRDPLMVSVLKQFADTYQAKAESTETLRNKVITYMVRNLPNGNIQAESTAESLNMSRSTLLRKLKEEGTTFKMLFDFTRKELAVSYLKQNFSASEIAYFLGFSAPSAFQHSFKRWFGVNPGEMKKSMS